VGDVRDFSQHVEKGLDRTTCNALVDWLVEDRFLKQTSNGTYTRVDTSY